MLFLKSVLQVNWFIYYFQELAGQPVGIAAAETSKTNEGKVARAGLAKLVKDVSICMVGYSWESVEYITNAPYRFR
jgi:hypothetical protein